jgi:hypothetical protein
MKSPAAWLKTTGILPASFLARRFFAALLSSFDMGRTYDAAEIQCLAIGNTR